MYSVPYTKVFESTWIWMHEAVGPPGLWWRCSHELVFQCSRSRSRAVYFRELARPLDEAQQQHPQIHFRNVNIKLGKKLTQEHEIVVYLCTFVLQ